MLNDPRSKMAHGDPITARDVWDALMECDASNTLLFMHFMKEHLPHMTTVEMHDATDSIIAAKPQGTRSAKPRETPTQPKAPKAVEPRPVLTKNAVRCTQCNGVIESKHHHDFVECPCGNIAVDGGLAYQRLIGQGVTDGTYVNLAEYNE